MTGRCRVEIVGDADVPRARAAVRSTLVRVRDEVVYAAELITTELVTNALLHGGGVASATISLDPGVARIEVADLNRHAPLVAVSSTDSMTGRGLGLVRRAATRWGVEPTDDGKIVWAEIDTVGRSAIFGVASDDHLDAWTDPLDDEGDRRTSRVRVSLGDVPTGLLVAAKRHVDNLLREFALAASGGRSGTTAPIPEPLAQLVDRVANGFEEARIEIKRRATAAAHAGNPRTWLELDLHVDAADAAEEYLLALDEIDTYSRANRLLTLETPPQHRVFRHWYIGELVTQLRAVAAGRTRPQVVPFETRLLAEVDAAENSRRAADRAARLYAVAVALASAVTVEEVASAVLREGVEALGASGGGVLLGTDAEHLVVPATLGYDDPIVDKLRLEHRDAELPAAFALRTGEAVWLETVEERDARFPGLLGLEPDTTAMCAVPVAALGRVLGALRFSFRERRLFDDDEQRFVFALAAETAEALQRAELLESERQARRRIERLADIIQQSLLPEALPDVDGVDVGATYRAAGEGAGGDFYDMFPLGEGRWGIAMGDVRGRGPQAAALTSLARYTVRTAAVLGQTPAGVLAVLNDAFISDDDPERFCSAVFAVLDLAGPRPRLTYASAGHPPLAHVTSSGVVLLAPTGGLVGITPHDTFDEREVRLAPGDAVVLYTDGITEARDGSDEFGERGLVDALERSRGTGAQAISAALNEAARAFSGDGASDDSAAFVVAIR